MSYIKTLVKSRPHYYLTNNILKIDNRIESYDYEIQSDICCIYTFNKDFNCLFVSSINDPPVNKRHLTEIFPQDMHDFFIEILEETITKKKLIKYHIQLNNKHILFTCNLVYDLSNDIVFIALSELPFRNVQSISVISPKLRRNIDKNDIFHSYIINDIGEILGWGPLSERKYFLNDILNFKVGEKCSIYNMILSTGYKEIWSQILLYIKNGGKVPIHFYIYTDNSLYEQKTQITINKMNIWGEKLFLLNSEIKSQKDFQYPLDYLIENSFISNNNTINNIKICCICKKIKLPKNNIIGKNNIIKYDDIIKPMSDDDNDNIPIFGKRSKEGKISYKDVEDDYIWMTSSMWNSYKCKNTVDKKLIEICNLCNDEFQYYLTHTLQT